ncbi:nucleotidyltransferase domain-containing protein [Psychrobacter sp. I-STPA10]|uniref:nucleotidyltransferase domain-containing protein n=1 Tax=Psychrobacter sp. I-STPA10 TaxID=2585769 RepID=UPI001E288391|nr:nucleotidyltransferase domain-containing protein [Psychrobacter sp. I-STPA10]
MQQDKQFAISSTIANVCADKQLHCLHAIESGSRVCGFFSPDSDYDVRLIYYHSAEWYVSVFDNKDTFEFISDDLFGIPFGVPFDIGGWELRKALRLIYKSNAVIFEWLNSPIIYQSQSKAVARLRVLSQDYFNPNAVFYHYRGMAKTANQSLDLWQPIKFKKFFYLLRALLAATWTITEQTPPPVRMTDMLGLLAKDEQTQILELIAIKRQVDEQYQHQLSPAMQQMICRLWQQCDVASDFYMDYQHPNSEPLDDFMRHIILSPDH